MFARCPVDMVSESLSGWGEREKCDVVSGCQIHILTACSIHLTALGLTALGRR